MSNTSVMFPQAGRGPQTGHAHHATAIDPTELFRALEEKHRKLTASLDELDRKVKAVLDEWTRRPQQPVDDGPHAAD
ncbi:hypothetical protein [Thermostilla marina]